MMGEILIVVLSYFVGSLPTALLVVRFFTGQDVRKLGSGNVGGTNALRAAGLKIGVSVTIIDCCKGALPVLLMRWYDPASKWQALAMLAAVLGHCFPIWLRFRGGKGVATGLGAFLVLAPMASLAALALWILILVIGRYVSVASMLASAVFPLLLYFISGPPMSVLWAVTVVAAVIVLRHQENMKKLMRGEESRLGRDDWDASNRKEDR